jgi:hypothetical protein
MNSFVDPKSNYAKLARDFTLLPQMEFRKPKDKKGEKPHTFFAFFRI